jgi:hypothetical protein
LVNNSQDIVITMGTVTSIINYDFLIIKIEWRAPKSRGETKLKVSQSQVAESRLGSTLPASNSRKG